MNTVKQNNTEMLNLLNSFLKDTLKKIMSAVSAECGSVFLFNAEYNELVLDVFYNSYELQLQGVRHKIGEGICGKVAEKKAPVLVKDIEQDVRFKSSGRSHYRTKSFISIPLFTSSGFWGIINLADKASGEPFSEKDLEFANVLCGDVSIIVDNLLYFMKLQQDREEVNRQKALLEKYASVGKLAAGIVHEVNNPLDGVIRYTNILLSQLENQSISREYLLEIRKGLYRIANITKSLLEFSCHINAKAASAKKYVNIHHLIDESLDVLNGRLNDAVRIHKRYKDDLPKVLDLGLSSVVVNIVKNALDSMPQGGKLDISTSMEDSILKISFQDTGLGMPFEIKSRIFEPFYTTKSIDKGTGLGLAICKEIINKYEGNIEVESSPGEGSTFTVVIPQRYLEKNAE